MCKEGVRIARRTDFRVLVSGTVNSGELSVKIPGNPNRLALHLSATWEGVPDLTSYLLLRAGGAGGPVLASLSPGRPSATLSLADFGQGIFSAVVVEGVGEGAATYWLTETGWLEPLSEL